MFAVYILYSDSFGKIYIGQTSSLIARFYSHNFLATKGWTIKFRPWTVVHVEFFELKKEALKREAALKQAKGREWLWSEIRKTGFSGFISA
ncbi:MAG: GIY-YIG nuclease family protein [Flammeovirgaceae bacterium]